MTNQQGFRKRPEGRGFRPKGKPTGPKPPFKKTVIPPEFKAQVTEIREKWNLPANLALRVAKGEITLDKAVKNFARRQSIAQLRKEHGFDGGIASLVIDNKITLEKGKFLLRWNNYKKAKYRYSIFDELVGHDPMAFGLFQQPDRVFAVTENLKYEFNGQDPAAAEPELIHKLLVKYIYHPDRAKALERAIKIDEEIKAQGLTASYKILDRYQLHDHYLYHLMEKKLVVIFTTLAGEVFKGIIDWFCHYEIGLLLKGGCPVVLLRHAILKAETKEGKELDKIKLA